MVAVHAVHRRPGELNRHEYDQQGDKESTHGA
jgi:hypothetical protein